MLRIERKTEIARKLRERKGGLECSAEQIHKGSEEAEKETHASGETKIDVRIRRERGDIEAEKQRW
jgi:hypothetical protein